MENFGSSEQPTAQDWLCQGEIIFQDQGTIAPLKQGNGVSAIVSVTIDKSVNIRVGIVKIP